MRKHYFKIYNRTKDIVLAERGELAGTILRRMKGLMFEEEITPLILRPCNGIHTFFMRKNIDVIFISSAGKVVKVIKNMPPWKMSGIVFGALAAIELPAYGAKNTERGDVIELLPL